MPRALRRANVSDYALFMAFVASLFGVACKYGAVGSQRARPDALIVLPNAIDVRDTNENEGTVVYRLNEEYPALPVIQTIQSRLERSGWHPLREDFLNPGLPSSLVRGWTSHEDRTQGRAAQVYQWMAQWEDDSKRIVWYDLTYDAVTESDGRIRAHGPLKVSATLLSSATVKGLQEIAAKNRRVPK